MLRRGKGVIDLCCGIAMDSTRKYDGQVKYRE